MTILAKAGLSSSQVEWVPLGPNVASRAAALVSHRVDATILTAPAYFKVERPNIRILANFAEQRDVFASGALIMSRSRVSGPGLAPPYHPGYRG